MSVTLNGSCADYRGLSTDEKPEEGGENALFLEIDTGDFYAWNGTTWVKIAND